MKKCVKINFHVPIKNKLLHDFIQQHARTQDLEGVAHIQMSGDVDIVACGATEAIENFLDALHRESATYAISNIAIESFVKSRDYRNIFRIIE